ncbi:MAG: pilus assembly protein PilM [Planctomycetes bacterium]|nr:pilus assembly protein PilM [Planctomycetota bacterium]
MARIVTGIDLGLRNAKLLRGHAKGNTFRVTDFALVPLASAEIADGWKGLGLPFKPTGARIGLTGREVNIRYTRVPRVPDWQLRNLMRFEVEEIGDQSGSGVASDFNLLPTLPEIEGEDVVLLAMARDGLLEAHAEGVKSAGGSVESFTPNAIALYNAFLRYGVVQEETVLLANIGYDNTDVVIMRGADLVFARNLAGGSRLFEDAIAQRLQVSPSKACEIKETLVDLDPHARPSEALAERARDATKGAAGQLLGLLQSTVLFCKSQIKISSLKLDRVLLCGGGSALAGLPQYLSSGLSVPVDYFDPFRVVDVSALAPEKQQELEQYKLESVVALGLATMSADSATWAIEILPSALAKKRAFAQRHAWMIAAGVLALGWLGFDAWNTSQRLAVARRQATDLHTRLSKAQGTHQKTEQLIAQNERLATLSSALEFTAGSGEQLARALDQLETRLPADFWLTRLTSDWKADPELRVPRGAERPVLSFEGRAREGTNSLATLYQAFVSEFRAGQPKTASMREHLAPNGARFNIDLSVFADPAPESKAGEK